MRIFGIDISKWQRGFNFNNAKKEGVQFCILRGAYGSSKDTEFESHYKNAKALGMGVGVYQYTLAINEAQAKAEAQYLINNCLKGKQFEYPIYIDVEDSRLKYLGKSKVASIIATWCNELEKAGYYAGIYTNPNWLQRYIDNSVLKKYDLWLASWSKIQPTNYTYGLWQFGGETNYLRSNKVAGVVCDQNYALKDYPTTMRVKGLNGFKKASIGKIVEKKPIIKEVIYTVVKGDTLSGIAKKYNTTWQKIYAKNKSIIGNNPNLIKVGQKLKI
jgi:lysozyme